MILNQISLAPATAKRHQPLMAISSVSISKEIRSTLLSRKEAARQLNLSPQTLAQWACSGRVLLPFIKTGRKVGYRQADLDSFLNANVHANTTY